MFLFVSIQILSWDSPSLISFISLHFSFPPPQYRLLFRSTVTIDILPVHVSHHVFETITVWISSKTSGGNGDSSSGDSNHHTPLQPSPTSGSHR
ncbi:hypothetical protein L1887_11084 [Cichorium endivia]|nr:hypothetical protein L1887_11084 [Cichorium endivia]